MGDRVIGIGLAIAGVNGLLCFAQTKMFGNAGLLQYIHVYYFVAIGLGFLIVALGVLAFLRALSMENKSGFRWEDEPKPVRDQSWKDLPANPQERNLFDPSARHSAR